MQLDFSNTRQPNGTNNCNGSGGYTDNTELAKNETNEEYALYPNPAKNMSTSLFLFWQV
jgi:hypothetical protein